MGERVPFEDVLFDNISETPNSGRKKLARLSSTLSSPVPSFSVSYSPMIT